MTSGKTNAKRADSTFVSDYKQAADEIARILGDLGRKPKGFSALSSLFRRKADKTAPNAPSLFAFDSEGPETSADTAATAANHYFEGLRNAILQELAETQDGSTEPLVRIVADISEQRNALLMYGGGVLPKRPDGLFNLIQRSPQSANDGRHALLEDVQSLIRISIACEKDFEQKRRQGRGYHTEFGYSRISYLEWLDRYIENRKSGKTHAQSLPIALKARSYRKIGSPTQKPDNTP